MPAFTRITSAYRPIADVFGRGSGGPRLTQGGHPPSNFTLLLPIGLGTDARQNGHAVRISSANGINGVATRVPDMEGREKWRLRR
jgi:hypothetical protein